MLRDYSLCPALPYQWSHHHHHPPPRSVRVGGWEEVRCAVGGLYEGWVWRGGERGREREGDQSGQHNPHSAVVLTLFPK